MRTRVARITFLAPLLTLVLAWLVSAPAHAQDPSPAVAAAHEAFDAKVLETLEPELRELWIAANEARAREDWTGAEALYTQILDAAPEFDHALRRRCSTFASRDRWADALADCKAAYELRRSPENGVSLASLLSAGPDTIRDPARAKKLAEAALAGSTNDIGNAVVVCQVGLGLQDTQLLDACLVELRAGSPEGWETYFFQSFRHAFAGDLGDAQDALDQAKAAGLDSAVHGELSVVFAEAESPLIRWGRRLGYAALLWVGLALLLIAAGVALSHLTLAEAERALHDPTASADAKDSKLRKAYAWVLWMCCAYYYLSIPLVLLSVLALAAAIVLGFMYLGRIPIKLVAIVVLVALGSVFAVLKSFFTRPTDEPPGDELDLAEAPGLRAALDEVAAKVGTRPVDRVYLEVGSTIAVFERGGMLDKLRGKGERCLLLGVAVLDGLDTQAFKAILAHEYGHFSNEDTAGGNFALAVRRSIVHSAQGLAEAGAAGWFNPAWVFMLGFHKLFLRISQGASRLQEVLADRWSARTYGAAGFERGLRHVIASGLRFDAHANASLREVVEGERGLTNIYRYETTEPATDEAEIASKVQELVDEEPSPYDSHPRPADRFRWAHAIAQRERGDEGGDAPSWALFSDRAAIEARMTNLIRTRIAAQTGVRIPLAEASS